MKSAEKYDDLKREKRRWKDQAGKSERRREAVFTTVSGEPIETLYTPDDISEMNYLTELGFPGEFPYTRGVHQSMYRGKLWTMRQFAGFGTPEDTNERFKYLLEHGQTGLSTAFDLPTLMGRDSDDPLSEGEVGICGVSVSSLADMEILFKGIPLDKVSTSMTINAPAAMALAFYIVVAEKGRSGERTFERNNPSGHLKRVHRAEGVDLSADCVDEDHHRHVHVLRG